MAYEGTSFTSIYERAVFKFTDYSFLTTDQDVKEGVMLRFLLSAITDFQHDCHVAKLWKYDLESECFEDELDEEVLEILSLGVAYYWLSAKTLNSKLLKNIIYPSNYVSYSPANLLKEMSSLRDTVYAEFHGKLNRYSFLHGNIDQRRT